MTGAKKPAEGRELTDKPKLAEALMSKTQFAQEEWDDFGISDLRYGDFIKSGGAYFKPIDFAAERYFKTQNKFRLSHANGECVNFDLHRQAFSTGNNFNEDTRIPLTVSPCSRVTVPENQRKMVRRNCLYIISHHHEIVLTACMARMDAARDSTKGLVFLLLLSLEVIWVKVGKDGWKKAYRRSGADR